MRPEQVMARCYEHGQPDYVLAGDTIKALLASAIDREMEKHCVALMILKVTGCSDEKATEAAKMVDRYYEGFKDELERDMDRDLTLEEKSFIDKAVAEYAAPTPQPPAGAPCTRTAIIEECARIADTCKIRAEQTYGVAEGVGAHMAARSIRRLATLATSSDGGVEALRHAASRKVPAGVTSGSDGVAAIPSDTRSAARTVEPAAWRWKLRGEWAYSDLQVYEPTEQPLYAAPTTSPDPAPSTASSAEPVAWQEPTDAQLSSACMSYRHDYGLLDATAQQTMKWQAKEWLIAWRKEGFGCDRNEVIERCAVVVDKANKEGPYQAIASASRIRALKGVTDPRKHRGSLDNG